MTPARQLAWEDLDTAHRAIPDCEHNRAWWREGPGRPVPPDCEHNRPWRASIAAAQTAYGLAIEAEHLAKAAGLPPAPAGALL